MKKTALVLAMVLCVGSLLAQKPVKGISGGGVIEDGIAAVLSPGIVKPIAVASGTLTPAPPMAVLETTEVYDTVVANWPYNANGITLAADEVTEGVHTKYVLHGHPLKYDLLTKLHLHVIPCGNMDGEDIMSGTDADGNDYNTVAVAGYCWTKTNLKPTTVEGEAMAYDDEATNADTYGRLYTWYSAVGLPDESTSDPTADANGYVQGLCPANWHIPTEEEMQALQTLSSFDLNATTLWQGSYASQYTDAYGFTALPAGMYNATLDRYEGLGTQTDWWTVKAPVAAGETVTATSYCSIYSCNVLIEKQRPATDGLSVRCVKNMKE